MQPTLTRRLDAGNNNMTTESASQKSRWQSNGLSPVVYTLPAYWASYLINGDDSGISDEDKAQADAFLAKNDLPGPVSCEPAGFQWTNDATNLGGDCEDFTFLIRNKS